MSYNVHVNILGPHGVLLGLMNTKDFHCTWHPLKWGTCTCTHTFILESSTVWPHSTKSSTEVLSSNRDTNWFNTAEGMGYIYCTCFCMQRLSSPGLQVEMLESHLRQLIFLWKWPSWVSCIVLCCLVYGSRGVDISRTTYIRVSREGRSGGRWGARRHTVRGPTLRVCPGSPSPGTTAPTDPLSGGPCELPARSNGTAWLIFPSQIPCLHHLKSGHLTNRTPH